MALLESLLRTCKEGDMEALLGRRTAPQQPLHGQ